MRKKYAAFVSLLCAAMSLNFCLISCSGQPGDSASPGGSDSENSADNSSGETLEVEYNTSYTPVYCKVFGRYKRGKTCKLYLRV